MNPILIIGYLLITLLLVGGVDTNFVAVAELKMQWDSH